MASTMNEENKMVFIPWFKNKKIKRGIVKLVAASKIDSMLPFPPNIGNGSLRANVDGEDTTIRKKYKKYRRTVMLLIKFVLET